jgi:hypothetical protein
MIGGLVQTFPNAQHATEKLAHLWKAIDSEMTERRDKAHIIGRLIELAIQAATDGDNYRGRRAVLALYNSGFKELH